MLKAIKLVLWMALLVTPFVQQAQNYTQNIRGKVVDEISGRELSGAEISIPELGIKSVSDKNGIFRLENVQSGRYSLVVTHPEQAPFLMEEVVVVAGKELVLDVEMDAKSFELEDVEIVQVTRLMPKSVSSRFLTVEETKRFASAYWDPARLAPSFPGIIQTNDQSNRLSIRGNNPDAVQWRLEGAEIVAPNHLNNAGTFSDRPTFSGGGTSMLSTQLMGRSLLSTGAFPVQYGNVLGGVFDVGLRRGNNEQFEFTAQAGLVGIDLSAEGPLTKRREGSFLFNYRYSTVGLLALLGVPLGDERINYQDFAFHVDLPESKAGRFSLFGLMGNSITESDHRPDSTLRDQKDLFDIRYASNTQVLGGKHVIGVGEGAQLTTVIAHSNTSSFRTARIFIDSLPVNWNAEADELERGILSLNSTLAARLNSKLDLKVGLTGSRRTYFQRSEVTDYDSLLVTRVLNSGEWASWMGQAFAGLDWRLSANLKLEAGLHALYYVRTGDVSVEPRVSLTRFSGDRHRLQLAYGLHSQEQFPGNYTFYDAEDPINAQPNSNLGLNRAHHYVGSYQYRAAAHTYIQLEPYVQRQFNVAIVPDPTRPLSSLNHLEPYLLDSMVNAGQGLNYGVELAVERKLVGNFYYMLSGSVFESKYEVGDGVWRESQWAGKYVLSGSGGWEKRKESKKGKQQVFGLNLRAVQRGGFRALPIDVDASRLAQRTVFRLSDGYEVRLPDYRRVDFRFTYQRNRKGFVSTFAVDIQNVLNLRNVAFYYYDRVADAVLTKNQLGIIPVISYRVEF